jgi:NAD(P)-dependent dehydrogenase (short-subunit alcohol dehydrogenase family)
MSTGIVIGATGGIGAACARRLAGSVTTMVLSGRRQSALDQLVAEIGRGAVVVPADLTTDEGRRQIVDAVKTPVSWVVFAHGMPLRKPLAELAEDEIVEAYATNLVGPTLLMRRLLDLEWDDAGSVVIVGSISAARALPRRTVYGATKAGLEHLGRSLAAELAPRAIRVNIVSPGVIDTPFLGEDRSALAAWVEARVPQRRVGSADEVARTVAFVLLAAPGYLNGARIVVDGGTEVVA